MLHHGGISRALRNSPELLSSRDAEIGLRRRAATNSVVAPQRMLALFAARDLEALIDTAFSVLRAAVTCKFVSAFYRSAGNGLLKERDSRGREYSLAFMQRYLELTPALPVALANRGIKVLLTRRCLPRSVAELHRSAFYGEVMRPQGWRHAVALCFWGEPPAESPIFVTSVYRGERQRDFSEQEVATLEHVHPFLDCAVNRVLEYEAAQTMRDGMAVALHEGSRGVAILDRNLHLLQANPAARKLCAAWVDDAAAVDVSSSAWRLPPVLRAACGELHDEWQSLLRADPDSPGLRRHRLVVDARVPDLTASITICPSSTGLAEPTFVLELQRRVHGIELDMLDHAVPVLQKMTAAERAVAMVLADGLSNQEIADKLGKSVDAVKFLLHRIYQKTGISNRAALVAVLRTRSNR